MPERTPRSAWEADARSTTFLAIERDLAVDVAVVGAGITGTTLASLLADAGVRVALIEARNVGGQVTRYSTGHLTALMDAEYYNVESDFGEEVARIVAQSTMAAIDHVEDTAIRFGVDCDFRRVTGTYFAESADDVGIINDEHLAARRAGLDTSHIADVGLPFPTAAGVRLQRQGEFNPLAYTVGLALTLTDRGGLVFESSRVQTIQPGDLVTLEMESGARVTAARVVLATHTPLGFDPLQTLLVPYRSYVIGCTLADAAAYPDGIFFDTMEPYNYYRTAEIEGKRLLVAGGADHKTGDMKTPDPYGALEAFVRERFPVGAVRYRWGAEVFVPADGLPYVGPSPLRKNVFVATGLRGDGLTWGTVAALLLASLVRGEEHPWYAAYRSTRVKPAASAKSFLEHNVEAAVHFVADRFKKDEPVLAAIARGEGGLVEIDGSQTAAYRDDEGRLHLLSPVCRHMKCVVRWNPADRTWDCPCHGARYAPTGEVLSGPATRALEPQNSSKED
jgi:glycine/D-amino acid oxidase-like deaminating enzyme/nitrite reductase/ring-hydroxylating ferredoxin subunit